MSNVVDLDSLVPVDKKVIFGGRTWELPGDMPMELFVQLQMLTDQADEEDDPRTGQEIFDEMIAIMMRLFTYKVPTEDEEARGYLQECLRKLGIKTFMQLWRHIYGEEAAKEPDPTEEPETDSPDEENGTTTKPQTPEPTPSPESPQPEEKPPASAS